MLLLTYGALLSADPFIEESAEIMGASRWRILRTITLPLVAPAILAAALTVFLRRSPVEVNRCPVASDDRPAGCPKSTGARDAAG